MRPSTRIRACISLAAALGLVGAGAASADDISNTLDSSVDAVLEVMPLNVGGNNGTTQLYVTPQNGDGKNGCNLTGSTTLVLSVSSSNTQVATVSPSSVTFSSCGDTPTLSVSPVAQGSATISVTQTSNDTGATFNLAPARFSVNVAPPANTAPAIAVGGVSGGASYSKGAVPIATCQVTDNEDGNSSFPATLSAIAGPYASDGIGSQTASCSYTDGGGLTASASETYSVVDPSAPTIGYTLSPSLPDGDNGWYRSDVSLSWDVSELESPSSLLKTGCADQSVASDQVETTYTCSATSAGGSAGPVDVKIKRDATAPVVTAGTASGTVGSNGWYISSVTVPFTATDATSGPATQSHSAGSGTAEGPSVSVSSPPFRDHAGNTAPAGTASAPGFKIDLSDPTNVVFVGGPADASSHYFGSVPAAPTCTADDAVSGLSSCIVTGYSTSPGVHTATATATDNAGRQASAQLSYSVLNWRTSGFYSPVDGNGVLNTVKNGSTVPLKFEVFASTELTDTAIVKSFTQAVVTCDGTAPTDEVEVTTTGGTSLRYDGVSGQFVQNWQTPKKPGVCYKVTATIQDGSAISAVFKLR